MKIILSLLTILIIGITIYYILKKRKENFEVKGDKQPEVSEEIYDYNLEQAIKIWEDIVGPEQMVHINLQEEIEEYGHMKVGEKS